MSRTLGSLPSRSGWRFFSFTHHFAFVAALVFLVLTIGSRATAQMDGGDGAGSRPRHAVVLPAQNQPTNKPESLERLIPAGARFYVHAERLARLKTLVQKTHSESLIKRLSEVSGRDPGLFDLQERLAGFLNLTASIDRARLSPLEVAMVSSTWSDTTAAVWVTRLNRPALLTDWFPSERRTAETKSGEVTSFATDDGFTVCVSHDVAAMGRRQRGRSILREVYHNLTVDGAALRSLEASAPYRELAGELPAGQAMSVYISMGGAKGASVFGGSPINIERVLLGFYNNSGSLHVAASGAHGEKTALPAMEKTATEVFRRLPATTVAAGALRVDSTAALGRLGESVEAIGWPQLVSLFTAGSDHETRWQSRWSDVGPEVVVIWGSASSPGDMRPQLAVMARCVDARAVRSDVSRIMADGIRLLGRLEGMEGDALPQPKLLTYLGTPIVHLPLADFAGRSQFAGMRLAGDLSPSWAAWREWFIFTLTLEHMQRLLDAQNGLIPTLITVPEIERHINPLGEYAGLGMIQPGPAGEILGTWAEKLDLQPELAFANDLWRELVQLTEGGDDHRWLDVFEFQGQRGSGIVSVARVDAPGVSAIPLQPGDLVIGVNDQLLTLNDPLGTLEEVWESGSGSDILKVRLLRAGKVLEVDVAPGSLVRGGMATLLDSPAKVARKAAELMGGVNLAAGSIQFGPEQRFKADLVITCSKDER